MLRIMLIDGSNPKTIDYVFNFSRTLGDLPIGIILVSDKEQSRIIGNVEIVNIHDVPQRHAIGHYQEKYNFSIYKAIAPERAFFDYFSLNEFQKYSSLSLGQIEEKVLPYLDAFDFLVREKVDVVIEGLADTFKTSLAGNIAKYYKKHFVTSNFLYWWDDGLFFLDRLDQTSSGIDEKYVYYKNHPECIDRSALDQRFASKRASFIRADNVRFPLVQRVRQVLNRRFSYDPLSWKNWLRRRFHILCSRHAIRWFVPRISEVPADEKYVIFPLHVMPEAALLGSSPEIADQLNLIKNISMNLPSGVYFYVKEHPDQMIGLCIDFDFYRKLQSLPNVRIFKASASLRSLMAAENCLALTVINGTAGLEAALMRKPVFVFGRALYGAADCFIKPKDFDDFFLELKRIMQGEFQFDEAALYAMLQSLEDSITTADVDYGTCQTSMEMHAASHIVARNYLKKMLLNGSGA